MKLLGLLILLALIVTAATFGYARVTGLSARAEPSGLEAAAARVVRRFAMPAAARDLPNPVPSSEEAVEDGLAHFADHCATCHANDGSGQTDLGRGLFPKPPDMRAATTQALTDGELFYIIENGIRFTGMPAFGTDDDEGRQASWRLVHFIRHLPSITEAELARMQGMNPRPPAEVRQEFEEEQFLRGAEELSR